MQFIGEVRLGRLVSETQHGQVKETPSFGKMLSVISNGHRIAGPTVTVLRRGGWGRCEVRTAGSSKIP